MGGHGTINITAAQRYNTPGLGVDIEQELVDVATQSAQRLNLSHLVEFSVEDVQSTDLSRATAVASFLVPRHLKLIRQKLVEFLNGGGRLACYHYPLQGLRPASVSFNKTIFLYNKDSLS